MSSRLPRLVQSLAYGHDAWLVGGCADQSRGQPRDWDVMVPFSNWPSACHLIPDSAKPNSFGGWKVVDGLGNEIDVWPGELGHVMQNHLATVACHPRSGAVVRKAESFSGHYHGRQ